MDAPESPITKMLTRMREGDENASAELIEAVYEELRRLARANMKGEAIGHTLQPTALVHEAWMRVVGSDGKHYDNRAHFFRSAALAMRRILVDTARKRLAKRRGGELQRIDVECAELAIEVPDERVLEVDEALRQLEARDPRKGEIVNLRYFVGFSNEETASALDVSVGTVEREWRFIRARLQRSLDLNRDDSA